MKNSHPIDIWLRWLSARTVTGLVAIISLAIFLYLIVKLPFWIALPAGVAVLAAGAYALFLVLDRMDGGQHRSGQK